MNVLPPAEAVIAVAMSGGVDSSVAALLLKERGYRVLGMTMHLWTEADLELPPGSEPPPSASAERARHVAMVLGIPWHLVDLRRPFREQIVEYVIQEYLQGRTPNPCLVCNPHIKFGRLLEEARRLGATHLATGHYARIGWWEERRHLLRGLDRAKDQSYMLYRLDQTVLSQACFPLGELTKGEVRRIAGEHGLEVASEEESQEICFLKEGDYRQFLEKVLPGRIRPGPILDATGREIGRHKGAAFYTIGQRKGLGIAAPEPLYVIAIDAERNALIVGPARQLGRDIALVEELHYVAGDPPAPRFHCTAKIRYKADEVEAEVVHIPQGGAEVRFARPLRDITPGQGLVFYRGEEVLGGGVIAASRASGEER